MLMFSLYRPGRRSTVLGLTLMGVWLGGLTMGLLAARWIGASFGAVFLLAGATEPPFRNACLATVLPLFLSAFAVFFFHRFGAYLACAVRGMAIGFLMGVLTAEGGMWLCFLLLFSALAFNPVLLWYLWRRLDRELPVLCPDSLYALLAGVVLAAVDTWVVAPFLAAALSF